MKLRLAIILMTMVVGIGVGSPGLAMGPAATDPLANPHFIFPFPAGMVYTPFADDYGDGRIWNPDGEKARSHEGIDILAPKGTPIVAVGDGRIMRIGWNQYGGWRITIALDLAPDYWVYYAHLNGYGENLYEGKSVRRGDIIGYVGNTGYGPQGTEDNFLPHLHLGIYVNNGRSTVNPYPYLRLWEERPKIKLASANFD